MLSIRVDDEIELPLLLPQHAEPLFALIQANRQRLRPWLPWVDRTQGPEDTRVFAEDALRRFAEGSIMALAIRYGGSWAGGAGLKIDRLNQRGEIGYWIAQAFEGRGAVTRAAQALTDYAFDELRLHRVEIRCAPGNFRSCAVPERLGFACEGILRQSFACNGEFQDMRVYAQLSTERRRA